MSASGTRRLCAMTGDARVDEIVAAASELMRCVLLHRIVNRDILGSFDAVLDYLRATMAFAANEGLRVLYLDARNRMLIDELASTGTVDSVSFYVRGIVARALEVGANGIVLAHNHPSGEAAATEQDVIATRQLSNVCRQLGIEVHDHLVIASEGFLSMRRAGILA